MRIRLEAGRSFGPEIIEMHRADGVQAFLLSTYQLPGATPLIWANFIDHTEQRRFQEQMYQNQKLELLGQLAGGIAHEFNNLLAIFQGHLALLARECPPESPMVSRVHVLERTTQRGTSIVKQLLTLARRRPMNEETFAVDALLAETMKLVSGFFPETLALTVDCEPGLPDLRGDPDQLGQALLNLMINARDAMAEGGNIVLAARRTTSGSEVRIEVADEGPGVPFELVSKIFDPFFTTKKEGKGTGLGLSLVATVAKAHRGTFGVESRSPRGSLFFIVLPLAPGPEEAKDQDTPFAEDRPPQGSVVLLVENEEDLASFESQMLRHNGYEVVRFSSGEPAWRWLQAGGQAVAVVTDLGMPGMQGETLCALIRSMEDGPSIVVQSGNLEPEVQTKLEGIGVQEFLIKPFTLPELLTSLQRILARDRP